jgi:energy-coupling factor transporter ATP-binding protein EcfA2
MRHGYSIIQDKVLIDFSSLYCETSEKLLGSLLFEEILIRYLKRLSENESPIYDRIKDAFHNFDKKDIRRNIIILLRLLNTHKADQIVEINEKYAPLLNIREILYRFIEGLYNFWRKFERYIILSAPQTRLRTRESIHHAQFIKANEILRNLVLKTYRTLCENIIETPFRVYRQLPAGAHIGLFTQHVVWDCPPIYQKLLEIPFIRLVLLQPPAIFYPQRNKRKGLFKEVDKNPVNELELNKDEWFCYPAKIGKLLAFAYFHKSFMSLGTSLANLFDIAQYEDIYSERPDIILLFGGKKLSFSNDPTAFYHDKKNSIIIGYIVNLKEVDYFGYMKKMLLTLHNLLMIDRGLIPIHGAMVSIRLKSKAQANIIIVGDSGAGKSETLEAFRQLAKDYINEMTIIFDDMGSLEMTSKNKIIAYGTETGAFLRIDDLQPGYAYEEIDRSIFMNPNLTNARIIIPVTFYNIVVAGTPVDFFLYANNYETISENQPAIELFDSVETALPVFNSGKRMAKGTTSEVGLTESYFANPFGAPQRRKIHEILAEKFLNQMFTNNIAVGQIRTQLAITGMEQKGPRLAAKALFELITKRIGIKTKYNKKIVKLSEIKQNS